MKHLPGHQDNRSPIQKSRDHLNSAKEELTHCTDEQNRYVCMTLVWCIESILDLLELHSVPNRNVESLEQQRPDLGKHHL